MECTLDTDICSKITEMIKAGSNIRLICSDKNKNSSELTTMIMDCVKKNLKNRRNNVEITYAFPIVIDGNFTF
jgi:hypothetical protein